MRRTEIVRDLTGDAVSYLLLVGLGEVCAGLGG